MRAFVPSRWLAGAAGALLVLAALVAGFLFRDPDRLPPRPPDERPPLLLLTSLPLVFPESFTLDAPGSPALDALRSRYEVIPISIADRVSLRGRDLLLMAQPRAQTAQTLVELDRWVRGGGHVLLLADPMLEWPSERPLGDPLRPPIAFADTGLLGHWGLRLDAPDRRGPKTVTVDGMTVIANSPGTLVETGPNCEVSAGGFIARCRIGRGEATVIADADFLGVRHMEGAAGAGNLPLLLRELARLEQ